MQPSGRLHLGNLVGALQNWVRLQDADRGAAYDCFYFIADWHALTSNYANPGVIGGFGTSVEGFSRDLLVNFLAAGLDPQKCTIFMQSQVLEHAELHLLLSMITPLGWLERVPTFKEKQDEIKDRDLNTYGFLGYPVLQSADILIYRAEHVPVGEDQRAHLEITREIARRFNHLYGQKNVLVEPEALLTEFPKVPGVDGRKMSKSYDNAVYLSDAPETLQKKILTMMTDPARKRRTDAGDPNLCPAYQLHRIFTSSRQELAWAAEGCRTAGIGCIECKKALIKNLLTVLEPIWTRRQEFLKSPSALSDILREGNRKASVAARETMEAVRAAMGAADGSGRVGVLDELDRLK
jgi:tryptophanyl-tRNA synthetase